MGLKRWIMAMFVTLSVVPGVYISEDYEGYTEDIELRDHSYYRPTVEEFQKYYAKVKSIHRVFPKYKLDLWDCDDYCELYKPLLKLEYALANPDSKQNMAVFVAYIEGYEGEGGHALLTVDFKDIGVRFIDPQNHTEPQGFEYKRMGIR